MDHADLTKHLDVSEIAKLPDGWGSSPTSNSSRSDGKLSPDHIQRPVRGESKRLKSRLGPWDMIGEICFLGFSCRYPQTVIALQPSELYALTLNDMRELQNFFPQDWRALRRKAAIGPVFCVWFPGMSHVASYVLQ